MPARVWKHLGEAATVWEREDGEVLFLWWPLISWTSTSVRTEWHHQAMKA